MDANAVRVIAHALRTHDGATVEAVAEYVIETLRANKFGVYAISPDGRPAQLVDNEAVFPNAGPPDPAGADPRAMDMQARGFGRG